VKNKNKFETIEKNTAATTTTTAQSDISAY
jgi:hypothetical protein